MTHSLVSRMNDLRQEAKDNKSLFGVPLASRYQSAVNLNARFRGRDVYTPLGLGADEAQKIEQVVRCFVVGARTFQFSIDPNAGEAALDDAFVTASLLTALEHSGVLEEPPGSGYYNRAFELVLTGNLRDITGEKLGLALSQLDRTPKRLKALLEPLQIDLSTISFPTRLVDGVCLIPDPDCTRQDLERMVNHLVDHHKLHVHIQVNPALLDKDILAGLLHEKMGYSHWELDDEALDTSIDLSSTAAMIVKLNSGAEEQGCSVGMTFAGDLPIRVNGKPVKVIGPPTHPLAMNLMQVLREKADPNLPCAVIGGVDAKNFGDAAAAALVPVYADWDVRGNSGWSRIPSYFSEMEDEMEKQKAKRLDQFIRRQAMRTPACPLGKAGWAWGRIFVHMLANEKRYNARNTQLDP